MKPSRRRARRGSRGVVVLTLTLVVVVGLLVQSLLALRSHRAMVDATLRDYAGFAGERIATELDETFSGLFLDQLALSRSAHYAWMADSSSPRERPTGPRALSKREVPVFFTVDGERVIVHGEAPDPSLEARVAATVGAHRDTYPPPAPYAVLRGQDAMAVVYRKEALYEQESIYGFVVDLVAFDRWYDRIVERTPLLPRSLGERTDPERILSIGLHLDPRSPPIFSPGFDEAVQGPRVWAFAAKAGRLAVGVRIDERRGAGLVAGGGPGGGLTLLTVLALITMGLVLMAAHLVRRSARLSAEKEAFVANVSHDLRTPLTQIRMFAETLLMDRLPDREDRRRSLNVIRRQAEILQGMVDNILHASDRGPPLEPRSCDLSILASDVVGGLCPSRTEGSTTDAAQVELDVEGDLTADVDPVAFTRILTNLLDNAIRYGPDGEPIRVRVRHEGPRVEVRVEDRGGGLTQAEREKVFERFERLGRDEDTTGTGIGLTVVRDLAERHGGGAHLESPGGGGVRAVAWIEEAPGREHEPGGEGTGAAGHDVEDGAARIEEDAPRTGDDGPGIAEDPT